MIKSAEDAVYRDPAVPIQIDIPPGAKQVAIQIWNRFERRSASS